MNSLEERGGLSASGSTTDDRTQNQVNQATDSCGNVSTDTTFDTTAQSVEDAPKQKKDPWWQDAPEPIKPGDTCWSAVETGACEVIVKSYNPGGMYVVEDRSELLVVHPSRLHKTKAAALTTLINAHREQVYNHEATVKALESMLKEEQEAGNA